MQRAERGFTLLEVLAAVAVLGILYTVLMGLTARWLGAEGEARRRLQASLVADQVLGQMETDMAIGLVPPLGAVEREEDWYRLKVVVSALPWDGGLGPPTEEESPAQVPQDEESASPVRRIDVSVSWTEAFREAEVSRTTYAYDLVGLLTAGGALEEPEAEP